MPEQVQQTVIFSVNSLIGFGFETYPSLVMVQGEKTKCSHCVLTLCFIVLCVIEVVLGRTDSDILRVVRSLITSSYLDRQFTNDAWELKSVTTLQNELLEQQYMYVLVKFCFVKIQHSFTCIPSWFICPHIFQSSSVLYGIRGHL